MIRIKVAFSAPDGFVNKRGPTGKTNAAGLGEILEELLIGHLWADGKGAHARIEPYLQPIGARRQVLDRATLAFEVGS